MQMLTPSRTAGAASCGRPGADNNHAVVTALAIATASAGPSDVSHAVSITAAKNKANGTWMKKMSQRSIVSAAATTNVAAAAAYFIAAPRAAAAGASLRGSGDDEPASDIPAPHRPQGHATASSS